MGQRDERRDAASRVEVTLLRPSLLGKVRKGRREAVSGDAVASAAPEVPPREPRSEGAATHEAPRSATDDPGASTPAAPAPRPAATEAVQRFLAERMRPAAQRPPDPTPTPGVQAGTSAERLAVRARTPTPPPARRNEARPRLVLSAAVDPAAARAIPVAIPPAPTSRVRFPAGGRALFIGQLAHMLGAGVALPRALDALRAQAADDGSRAVVEALTDHLYRGRPLSSGMAALGDAFTPMQVGIVRAAETAGDLPGMLGRLAAHEESDRRLSLMLRSRLTYPVVVLSCAFTMVAVLAQFLVAAVAPMVARGGVPLSPATEALFAVVDLEGRPLAWLAVVGALALAGRAAARWMRSAAGRRRLAEAARAVPLLGPLLRTLEEARACEGLAVMARCGVPLLQGMRMVAGILAGEAGAALEAAAARVQDGMPLAEALRRTGCFSLAAIHMVAAGEESGRLSLLLEKAAAYQDLAVRTAIDSLAAMLEPLAIAGLGVLVAGVILVAFAPLYQMIAGL